MLKKNINDDYNYEPELVEEIDARLDEIVDKLDFLDAQYILRFNEQIVHRIYQKRNSSRKK